MSATLSPPATTTSPAPSSAPTQTQTQGPQNSPLLFFVALGFGVVFTNLWIIVGVKYCFRYNARNRARQHDENGEPIDLTNMPHRRRRREKKLMTTEEVDERFPVTKYKTWVSSRAAQGLSTAGGVSQSRAASVRDAEGAIEPLGESSKTVASTDVASAAGTRDAAPSTPTTSTGPKEMQSPGSKSIEKPAEVIVGIAPINSTSTAVTATGAADHTLDAHNPATAASMHSADDDEDAIAPAVPGAAEMLEAPGDTCAICIDTLEEDDDVRGLTCGHAFHASCIDPWLTNRRACCPLCKADYYVPKQRPDQLDGQNGERGAATFDQMGAVRRPSLAAEVPAGGISRYVPRLTGRVDTLPPERASNLPDSGAPGANAEANQEQRQTVAQRFASAFRRDNPEPAAEGSARPAADDARQSQGRRWVPSMPNFRRNRSPEQVATPSQLEAGAPPAQVAVS